MISHSRRIEALPSNINQTDFSAHTFIYAHPFHQNTISLLLIFLFSYGSPCFSLFHIKNQKFSNFPTIRIVNLFNSFTLNSLSNFVHFFKRVKFFNSKFYLLLYIFWWHRTRPGYQGLVALLSLRFRENFQFKWESGSFGLKRLNWKCCRYGREEQVVGNERRVRERGRDFSSIL